MRLSARSQGLQIQQGGARPPDAAQPGDVALLLHTSGTTSRPKAVPLSHGNLRASLTNLAGTYQLTGSDRWAPGGLGLQPEFQAKLCTRTQPATSPCVTAAGVQCL